MLNFQFKPFEEMTEEDYSAIGFKSGLEIHQQLLTNKKLFCRCPAGKYSHIYDAEILRHMRPTLSELGEYDGTALMEFKTKKEIIYRINRNTVCTYEMDDTPPFLINEDALDVAIGIGILLNCNIIDELHIARKQYLDGSIPTGFQRTAIYALDGKIPYKDREIKIVQMSIEEDSCREVSDIGHQRVYLTDRLGMPLIETVTGPDMKTPFEVAEVAEICRLLVRSTKKVRTGIGAAREDVNVSVEGGTRIEIKGVPKISKIPLLTYNEAMRQWNLLRLREELKKRKITPETFEAKTEDVSKVIRNPKYQPLKDTIENNASIKCVVLKGFSGLLHWETQTNTFFAKEISDRVRVIACLSSLPNIIHSDSKSELLTSTEWQKIKKAVEASDNDTMIIVWGNNQDAETAAKEIIIRAKEATIGIPSETRQAHSDGTNGFERILPGPDRMYPDTDLPPKKITQEKMNEIKLGLPEQFWKLESWFRKLKIPEDVIRPLAVSDYSNLFKELVNKYKMDPVLVSVVLIQFAKRLRKKNINSDQLNERIFRKVLLDYNEDKLAKDGILIALEQASKNIKGNNGISLSPVDERTIENAINDCKKNIKKIKLYNKENELKVLMGMVMKKLRGKVDGHEIFEKIKASTEEKV